MLSKNRFLYLLIISVIYASANAFPTSNQILFSSINVDNGLSHNQVNCIFKDSYGFVWFGTMAGLNRFDGTNIKCYKHDLRDSTSLSGNYIEEIYEDPEGYLWVHNREGNDIYDPRTEKFIRVPIEFYNKYGLESIFNVKILKDKFGNFWFTSNKNELILYSAKEKKIQKILASDENGSLHDSPISDISSSNSYLWVIHNNGILEKLDLSTNKIVFRNETLTKKFKSPLTFKLLVDTEGDIWIYTSDDPNGVFLYHHETQKFEEINKSSYPVKLNSNLVKGAIEDENGNVWLATDHGGINVINKKNSTIDYLLNDPDDKKSLCQNSVYAIYKDDLGIIWAGTYKKGISFYHRDIYTFPLFVKKNSEYGLPCDDINCFFEDDLGNLWLGTNGNGLIYFNRQTGKYKTYNHDPNNPNSLSNDVIVSLFIDSEKKLWIGTYYGGLNVFDGKTFKKYKNDPVNPSSIAHDCIWTIYEDSRNNLWIGTLGGGLDLFDRKRNIFYHYKQGDINSVGSNYITSIIEDKDSNLWIGTSYGLDFLDRSTGRFINFRNEAGNYESLSNNNINALWQDSRGLVWIGTREGLNFFNKETNKFRVFRQEDGLIDNTIRGILEDEKGNIWVSTSKGLSKIILEKSGNEYIVTIKNYDDSYGLQAKEFNDKAAYKTSRGELVFGGTAGFNIFKLSDIETKSRLPHVVLTGFQIFNKNVVVGEEINGRSILNESITLTDHIVLKHNENMFSIDFAAIDFFQHGTKLEYKLEGFNEDWLSTDDAVKRAVYTNLDHGEYVFKVRAYNEEGQLSPHEAILDIKILPSFWQTKAALALYLLIILFLLLLTRKIILERERMKHRIQLERQEAHRMHELDMLKIKFFTNISHEFRTPLSLIITPLERMLKIVDNEQQTKPLLLIYRNAKRLLNLVNQLLDFRMMESQQIKLNLTEGDVIRFIKDIITTFSDISEKKNIHFSLQTEISELSIYFDQDKLEKILFNLLSNAFKFTPENGKVWVEVGILAENNEFLQIKVCDTGIGVPSENQEKIFERFFQNEMPGSIVNQGSGIGLALTKEFVKLHGGSISVKSEPENGSCFTVLLPCMATNSEIVAEFAKTEETIPLANGELNGNSFIDRSKKKLVLLVEDNEDFRFYLKDNLKSIYNIVEASNGKKGWQHTLGYLPDLVVTDIVMPEMDGIELCNKIKNDSRTSNIPVVMLTAKTSDQQKMEGFQNGADEYITKPFNFELLLSRVKNLIKQRESIKQAYKPLIEVEPNEIVVTSLDEKLIKKAIVHIEKNLSNADFSVEDLSKELCMSRVYLYKKLLALTGKSPLEFIRSFRLKRAAQLLEQSQLTVSEVAYQVGFNNPKYFTKYFKSQFKMLPSSYAETIKKEKTNGVNT